MNINFVVIPNELLKKVFGGTGGNGVEPPKTEAVDMNYSGGVTQTNEG
ncbi:hypothetical protein [Pseudoalteromonas sp. JC28]|nr:hypothetical protein [Pseudoalteromonas sp. JC28]